MYLPNTMLVINEDQNEYFTFYQIQLKEPYVVCLADACLLLLNYEGCSILHGSFANKKRVNVPVSPSKPSIPMAIE